MRWFRALLLFAAIAAALVALWPGEREGGRADRGARLADAAPAPPPQPARLTVFVQRADGEPATAARVEVRGPFGAWTDHAAGPDGRLDFADRAPGFYQFLAREGDAVGARDLELAGEPQECWIVLVGSLVVRGRVLDRDGNPVANADVEAVRGRAAWRVDTVDMYRSFAEPEVVLGRARSDATGAYVLQVPGPGRYALRVTAEGLAPALGSSRAHERDLAGVDFVLGPGVEMCGRIVDERGEPVAGAQVFRFDSSAHAWWGAPKIETRSDADGRFRVRDPACRQATFLARARGFVMAAVDAVPAGRAPEVTTELRRGVTVRVRVVDGENGRAVPGALVSMAGEHPWGHTDADGALLLRHVACEPGAGTRSLLVAAPGYEVLLHEVGVPDSPTGVVDGGTVAVRPGGAVHGVVSDASTGAPIADALVVARGGLTNPLHHLSTAWARTDGRGAYILDGAARGTFELVAVHPDHALASEPTPRDFDEYMQDRPRTAVFAEGEAAIRRDLVLASADPVTGVVVDANGDPVSGARVDVLLRAEARYVFAFVYGAGLPALWTDASGRFVVPPVVVPSVAGIVARHPRFGTSDEVACVAGEEPRVALRPPVSISGVLRDAEGAPVAGALVYPEERGSRMGESADAFAGASGLGMGRTDAAGRFRVRRIRHASPTLVFDHPRYQMARRDLRETAGGDADLGTIVLARGETLAGAVVDADGAPVPDVRVQCELISHEGLAMPAGRSHESTRTDAEGRFAFHGLEAGEFCLAGSADGMYGMPARAETGALDVRLVLHRAGVVRGRVVSGGAPVRDARIRLHCDTEDERTARVRFARTDAAGRFAVGALPPTGSVRLSIRSDAHREGSFGGIAIGARERAFELAAGRALGGLVVDDRNRPVRGVVVLVETRDGESESREARTGVDGRFSLAALPGDRALQISLSEENRGLVRPPARVLSADENEVRLVVSMGRSITGTIARSGSEFAVYATVIAVDPEDGEVARTDMVRAGSEFELTGLPDGRYRVYAEFRNHVGMDLPESEPIEVEAGASGVVIPAPK